MISPFTNRFGRARFSCGTESSLPRSLTRARPCPPRSPPKCNSGPKHSELFRCSYFSYGWKRPGPLNSASSRTTSSSSLDLTSLEAQRAFLSRVSEELGIKRMENWYEIRNEDIVKIGGSAVLSLYNGSLSNLLLANYPDHHWDLSKFSTKPRNYWNSIGTQRQFLEELGLKFGIDGDLSPWYEMSRYDVEENGGRGLLQLYNDSLTLLLRAVFPEHEWDTSKFRPRRVPTKSLENNDLFWQSEAPKSTRQTVARERTPNISRLSKKPAINRPYNYWKDPQNHIAFLQELAIILGIKDPEGWYNVTKEDFVRHGGAYLIRIHNSSVLSLLRSVFPDKEWDASKFTKKPQRHWKSIENVRGYLNSLATRLGFKSSDYAKWYFVRGKDIAENGGWHLVKYFGTLHNLMISAFPEHDWDATKFVRIAKHSQSKNARLKEVIGSAEVV